MAARDLLNCPPLSRVVGVATVAAVLVCPAVSHACSGPGAGALIARHTAYSAALFLAGAVLAIHLFWRLRIAPKKRVWMVTLTLLSLLHPIWWISAVAGDCGYSLFYASLVMSFIQVAATAAGHFSLRRAGRRGG